MAQAKAKKQPTRGARKASPSKRKAQKRKPKAPPELKPFKIVGQLIGARYDEHGDVVGEEIMGEVAIYRSNFKRVDELVNEAVEQARASLSD